MRILFLEPWYGGSRRRFLDGLSEHSAHEVRAVTMAPRYWTWRLEGGAVTLAEKAAEIVDGGWRPDLVVASDLVNLPAFLALTRRRLAAVPVVLSLHEDRLTYPLPPTPPAHGDGRGGTGRPSDGPPSDDGRRDYTYASVQYLSALAADRVLFNSAFHRDDFFRALPDLLRRFPDYTHVGALPGLREKSTVLHPGLDLAGLDAARPAAEAQRAREPGPPVVLWNHRWEYDKDPAAFFRVVNRLDDVGARFRLVLAGKTFAEQPAAFEAGFRRYAERVLHYGYAETFAEYAALLWRSDVVVSTSVHEFFGMSMLEAIHCGCHPLLPDRLTYPELVPERLHRPLLHAPVLYGTEDDLFETLRAVVGGAAPRLPPEVLREVPADLAWPLTAPRFDALFEEVVGAIQPR